MVIEKADAKHSAEAKVEGKAKQVDFSKLFGSEEFTAWLLQNPGAQQELKAKAEQAAEASRSQRLEALEKKYADKRKDLQDQIDKLELEQAGLELAEDEEREAQGLDRRPQAVGNKPRKGRAPRGSKKVAVTEAQARKVYDAIVAKHGKKAEITSHTGLPGEVVSAAIQALKGTCIQSQGQGAGTVWSRKAAFSYA